MEKKCIFCHKILVDSLVLLDENLEKLENLMQATEFDVTKIKNSIVCQMCNDMIYKCVDFKSTFMEKEDELLFHVNSENKVDLWKVLVSKGELQRGQYMDFIKICRICFKHGKADYKEIQSYQNIIAKIVNTCLPEFDLFLTSKTFLCLDCNKILLKYYNFLMTCANALKGNPVSKDPLSLENEPLDKRKETTKPNRDLEKSFISEESLLVPVQKKRGRGRPRKFPAKEKPPGRVIKRRPKKIREESNFWKEPGEVTPKRYRRSFECQICPCSCDSFPSMMSHLKYHKSQASFVCWKCGHQCMRISDLKSHFVLHGLALYKTVEEEIESDEEGFEGETKENAEDEVKTQLSELLENRRPTKKEDFVECQLCLKHVKYFPSFRSHMRTHYESGQFNCPKCLYESDNSNFFKLHLASVHGIATLYKVLPKNCVLQKHCYSSEHQDTDCVKQKPQTGEASNKEYCCGHCSGVFYSIEALDEHICSTPAGKSETATATKESSTDDKRIDAYYECSFCFLCFPTLKKLDTHICAADPEAFLDESMICSKCSENFRTYSELLEHTCSKSETITVDQPATTEDKEQFECFCCSSKFASYDAFAEHDCFKGSTTHVTKNPSPSLVKQELQFECTQCYVGFETEDELSQHACTDLNITSKDLEMILKKENNLGCSKCNATFYTEDESRKHTCATKDTCTTKDSENRKLNKKEVISNIAKIFGVKIAEGAKDRQTVEKKFDCVGCDFTTSKKKDLLIHFYHCEKVKQCHYCPYRTDVSQKLEMHCFTAHDIIIYSCQRCRFVTSMEENFEAHIAVHQGGLDEDYIMWADAPDNQEIADDPIGKETNSDAEDTGFHSVRKVELDEYNIVWADSIDSQEIDDALIDKEINIDAEDTEFHPVGLINPITSSEVKQIEDDAEIILPDPLFVDDRLSTYIDKPDLIQLDDTQSSTSTETATEDVPDILESNSPSPNAPTGSQDAEVIDIDSDSEDEFIESTESRMMDASTVVQKICNVDADDASELISQGFPVVSQSSLSQFQSVIVHSEKDEEDEFIESAESQMVDAVTVVGEIGTVDGDDTSQSISQGVLVVSESSLSQFESVMVHSENEADSFPNKNVPLEPEEISNGSSMFVTDNDDSNNDDILCEGADNDIDDTSEDVTFLDSKVVENLIKSSKKYTADRENKNLNSTATKRKKSLKNGSFIKKIKSQIQQAFNSKPSLKLNQKKNNTVPTTKSINTTVEDDCICITDDDEPEEQQQAKDASEATIIEYNSDSFQELTGEEEVSSLNEDNDDCVVVAEDVEETSEPSQIENESSDENKIKRPDNSFIRFSKKVYAEMKKNFPNAGSRELRQLIANTWKGMSSEEKWPFWEEARLHRLLFAREHGFRELNRKKPIRKQVPAKPVQAVVAEDVEETSETSQIENESSDENKIKRPDNSFIRFSKKVYAEMKKKFPDAGNRELRRIIANTWKGMSREEKLPFWEEARSHRLVFARKHGFQNLKKPIRKQVPAKPVQSEVQRDQDEAILIE